MIDPLSPCNYWTLCGPTKNGRWHFELYSMKEKNCNLNIFSWQKQTTILNQLMIYYRKIKTPIIREMVTHFIDTIVDSHQRNPTQNIQSRQYELSAWYGFTGHASCLQCHDWWNGAIWRKLIIPEVTEYNVSAYDFLIDIDRDRVRNHHPSTNITRSHLVYQDPAYYNFSYYAKYITWVNLVHNPAAIIYSSHIWLC